ncbi:MAG: hypothetical protein AAFU33_24195 [Bacteroidota bacterium]
MEKQRIALSYMIQILADDADGDTLDKIENVLTSFDYLSVKVLQMSPEDVISDFDYLPTDHELREVQSALQLSMHQLVDKLREERGAERYPYLAGQLFGRLRATNSSLVLKLLENTKKSRDVNREPWLRPLTASLIQPKQALERTFVGRLNSIAVLSLTPDGTRLISGHQLHYNWWEKYTPLKPYTNTNELFGQAFAPDESYDSVKVWDVTTGNEQVGWGNTHHPIYAIAPLYDTEHALIATANSIRVLNLKAGTVTDTTHSSFHRSGASFLIAHPDASHVIRVAPGSNQIDWCELPSFSVVKSLEDHKQPISALALTKNGDYLLSGDVSGVVCVWRCVDQKLLNQFKISEVAVAGLIEIADHGRLVTVDKKGICKTWD